MDTYSYVVIETREDSTALGHLFPNLNMAVIAMTAASRQRPGSQFTIVPIA